jgi:hypothetical protein
MLHHEALGRERTLNSDMVFSAVTTAGSIVAIAVAIYAVWNQNRQSQTTLESTVIRDLWIEFGGEHMMRCRLATATYLLDGSEDEDSPEELYDILDFFDSVGMYYVRGAIGSDVTWAAFYYWLGHYWNLIGTHARDFEASHDGVRYYHDVPLLYERLTDFALQRRCMMSPAEYFSKERFTSFLRDEVRTCERRLQSLPRAGVC